MANARGRGSRDSGRDPGRFVAIPWAVLDSPSYQALSHPARALLLEVARQHTGHNNGRMLLSENYLRPRGWKSADVIARAKRELLDRGLLFQTVQGQRPNKASWFALTWRRLDPSDQYDAGVSVAFEQGAYLPEKNAPLTPPRGVARPPMAPSRGVRKAPATPSGGAIRAPLIPSPTPSGGDHLEAMPSAVHASAREP